MYRDEKQSISQFNNPFPSFISNQSSLTNSTCFTSPVLWQSTLPPQNYFLKQFRKHRPSQNISFNSQKNEFFGNLVCKIFSFAEEQGQKTHIPFNCKCERTEDDVCCMVVKWVEEHYYWKTDKQFVKAYEYYSRKKQGQCLEEIFLKLENIVTVLGIKIQPTQLHILTRIIANYVKHTVYYSKSLNLIKQSELFLWVALGIMYHVGFCQGKKDQQLIFWSLDIAMNAFEDLRLQSITLHTDKVMQYLGGYYPKWINFLVNEKNINLKEIVREWISQMMFGYMGIQSIAFFIDCFMKMGWKYIYKVILSYFQHRTDALGRNQLFLTGIAKTEDILRILLDGQEEWPMIFCGTATFNLDKKKL